MTSFVLPHEGHGSGAHKVFAVHGWFADRSAYATVLPDLDRASFSYALVDLRGYGEARDATGSYTTAEAAVDLVEPADRLGWERFSVLGHSMGGAVAQRLLAVAPHRLRRIAEVSPVPASGLPLPPGQAELFADAAHRAGNRRAITDAATGGRRPAAWLDRMVARSLERSGPKAFRAWLDSWAGDDFSAEVAGSDVPAPGGFVWIRPDRAAASGAVHRKAEDHPRTGRTRVVRQRGVGVPPAGGWGSAVPGVADPG